jgi:hypothetical protein
VTTTIGTPERSAEQRMEALAFANAVRVRRARVKRDIAASAADVARQKAVRHVADPERALHTMKVLDLLLALPKVGRVKANRTINRMRISPSKTLAGLSERQRAELVRLLREPFPCESAAYLRRRNGQAGP